MNLIGKTGSAGVIAGAIISLGVSLAAPMAAADVATRCGANGCEAIRCNYSGDRCYHVDGYTESYGAYYRSGYRDYDGDGGYYGGHLVCDSDGDRCYRAHEPYWSYREYYRRHGYRWHREARYDVDDHDGYYRPYTYEDYREHRFTDRLNRDEAVRAHEFNDGY